MKKISVFGISIIFCALGLSKSHAQNLIPDGGFEETTDCSDPDKGFLNTLYWYPLEATPDLFVGGCQIMEIRSVFWTPELAAFAGNNYAGISSRVNSNQTYVSEGIATILNEPLKSDKLYYFEMQIRNKGFYQGFPDSLITCPLTPEKHIDLYVSDDSILIDNDFANGTAISSGELVAEIFAPVIQSTTSNGWASVSSCFVAREGAQHFGIMLPLGTFGTFPECAADDRLGTFYSFYYDIDQLVVSAMPDKITKQLFFEEGKTLELNLYTLLDFPLLDQAGFIWEDGMEGPQRSISSAGIYNLEAVFSCGSIPIQLEVEKVEADIQIYVPNVFSPNNDGINDHFEIYLDQTNTIVAYKFSVYDRWGNQIFISNDPSYTWDGTWRGTNFSSGIFIWFLECEIEGVTGIKKHFLKGDVLLSR